MGGEQEQDWQKQQAAAETKMKKLFLEPQLKLVQKIATLEKGMGVLFKQIKIQNELIERDIFPELQTLAEACEDSNLIQQLINQLDRLNQNLEKPQSGSFLQDLQKLLKP